MTLHFEAVEMALCGRKGCGFNTWMHPDHTNVVHPHHNERCELHPNNAWPEYRTVRLSRCDRVLGYHKPENCLGCNHKKRAK